jgi:acetyl-CoA carboxylase biotin carboxyl carrier protein
VAEIVIAADEAAADFVAAADGVTKPNPSSKEKKGSSQPKDRLEAYIKLMEEEDLHELEIDDGPFHLKLVREPKQAVFLTGGAHMPAAPAESTPEPTGEEEGVESPGSQIKAPLGGVFYRSPSPKSPAYVKEGDRIVVGQTIGIIEAMKVMNEIKSELTGRILKILVENGKPVEPNQTMFIVETE